MKKALWAGVLASFLGVGTADAAVVVTIAEVGTDVVTTHVGTLDIDALSFSASTGLQ